MRNRILLAAFEEMNLRGIKFTMSDLARRLNVSKTSLYDHFASKNELIHHILITVIQDIEKQEEAIYHNSELTFAEKISGLLKVAPTVFGPINNDRLYDELHHFYPEEFRMIDIFREQHQQRFLSLIVQGIENNAVRPVNLKVLHQLIDSALNDLFSYRFLSNSNMTYPDALSAMADIIVNGLLPKKE
ncbi:TetR/AcrR family transcriptional regulator [Propionispora hippei]|uniref:Transcriptional regulator, TetR family n=1 Tax=Propionispora hippei DSM 15287 TaxID=1123003 RepID=A0A1M6MC16_9FIRM|nr:TetR/AcrR family transcriptional regulator [Propionispora hippei]SHJ80803.1 transcriptional regulator, TetR family [Propionispora hippei DSM 15287]